MKGTTQARVHEVFKNRIRELQDNAKAIAKAARGEGQRVWQVPTELDNLVEIDKLHDPAFDREQLNQNYLDVMRSGDSPGTLGDVIGLKQQIDYNAVEERAFRTRHLPQARAAAMAAVRRNGHGNNTVLQNVEDQAGDAIKAGGSE